MIFPSKLEILQDNLFQLIYNSKPLCYIMNKRSINKFAILVILMIAVPEAVGHTLFERAHSPDSSVNEAIAFTDNLRDSSDKNGVCHLMIQSDQSGINVARASGLEGKYGDLSCT